LFFPNIGMTIPPIIHSSKNRLDATRYTVEHRYSPARWNGKHNSVAYTVPLNKHSNSCGEGAGEVFILEADIGVVCRCRRQAGEGADVALVTLLKGGLQSLGELLGAYTESIGK
jgi:hypothetical protein